MSVNRNSGVRSYNAPPNALPGYSYNRASVISNTSTSERPSQQSSASDWQYRGSSMTRTVTATSHFLPQPTTAASPIGSGLGPSAVAAASAHHPHGGTIGRSGSLKKAYSDSRQHAMQWPTVELFLDFFWAFNHLLCSSRLSLYWPSWATLFAAARRRSPKRRSRSIPPRKSERVPRGRAAI